MRCAYCVLVLSGFVRKASRVSYNGITSAFQADDAGSIPATRSKLKAHAGGLETVRFRRS